MGNLNEKTVLNFYIDQMEEDNIKFLEKKESVKKLLKEQIINLRDEEDMHIRITIAVDLWKTLFEVAMSYIDPDKGGYDDIFSYFDDYVEFEELIFASDSFYRDHTIHCLWVYFLGEYLQKNYEFVQLFKNYYLEEKFIKELDELLCERNKKSNKNYSIEFIEASNEMLKNNDSMRCIAALTHDLGYPLKKIFKINKSIKKVLPYFHVDGYEEFKFNYSDINQGYIQSFIKLLSWGVSFRNKKVDEDEELMRDIEKYFKMQGETIVGVNKENIRKLKDEEFEKFMKYLTVEPRLDDNFGTNLRYNSDFEKYEHGIMSAFLLMKTLSAFQNLQLYFSEGKLETSIENHSLCGNKLTILRSVSDHTSNGFKIIGIRNSSEFLIFVDEIEEFSRISRANKNRQYINEFCKTNIYMEDEWFNVDFIFDNDELEDIDPERAFKGRCKRMLTLFNISKIEENFKLRLRCIGKLPYDENVYELRIGNKYANILINGEEQSIPKYLKSRQFYTKEEYMNM